MAEPAQPLFADWHLFQADPYLAECRARVVAVGERDGAAAVRLERTVFYATGGGQPGDAGRLVWDGGEATVATAVKGAEPGEILHLLEPGAPPPPLGAEAAAVLDWDRRHRHMRMHTALHLLSVVLPFPVTGGQIGADKGRLDFDMAEAPEDKDALEARLRALIEADHAVTTEWISDAALAANPGLVKTMAVAPPTGQGSVRLVRIGSGGETVDLQPCGGTHVRRTAEIGAVRLGKIEKKGRMNRRVALEFV